MALTPKQLSNAAKRQARLIAICRKFPEAEIQVAGEQHLSFRIRKKTFAYYSFDHHEDGMIAFWCKSNLSEQRRQCRSDPDNFFVPAYLGQKGWLGIRLDLEEVDWDNVEYFARTAYQALAPRKLAELLD